MKMFRNMHQQMKKHPGLIPQFFFMSVGVGGAFLYLIRLARGPYISWDRKNNPEPWNNLGPTYQYKAHERSWLDMFDSLQEPKLVAVTTDYESLKKEGPDF